MQTNKVVQPLPRRLLFYFAPLLFLLACVVAMVIGYLVGSVLLIPFTHHPVMIGSLIGSFLYFLSTGMVFAAFTYGVVMIEKSQANFIFDHFRYMFFLYVLLIAIIFKERTTFSQAFLPIIDVNNDALIISVYTAKRILTGLGTLAVVIVFNLVVLYLVKKPKK